MLGLTKNIALIAIVIAARLCFADQDLLTSTKNILSLTGALQGTNDTSCPAPPSGLRIILDEDYSSPPPYIPPDGTAFIFNGAGTPESHGWKTLKSSSTHDPSVSGEIIVKTKGESDYFTAKTSSAAVNEYLYDTGVRDSFYVSFRLAVTESGMTEHDGGLTLSAIGAADTSNHSFVWTDRDLGLYLLPHEIGTQDTLNKYPIDATVFHTYTIVIKNGEMKVYIDKTPAEIQANQASPVITRKLPSPPEDDVRPGVIVFGDTTNEDQRHSIHHVDVNSHYKLDYITFKQIP